MMSKTHHPQGLGLAEAVQALRADLLAAQRDPAHPDIRFPIREITINLQVGAVRTADGRAGFRVPVVNLDLGGSGGLAAGGAADHHGRVRPAGRPLG